MAVPRIWCFKTARSTLTCVCMLAILAALASCATTRKRPPADSFRLEIADRADARRVEVSLTSLDVRAMCIPVEQWPGPQGGFAFPQNDTYLQVDAQMLPASSSLFSAFCPGGCGELRIAPKTTLRGVINYATFGDAEAIAAASQKELHFIATPYYCR
ncbi:hypothetical protein [Stenotrophomonas maltophilia]|uniref:hypothetical protein n=1 Tax=Stenotrophomonas maltophilia TaxID=40324 RepID=UPI0039F65480